MNKTTLNKAVVLAIAGASLYIGAATTATASTTMYNSFLQGTDPSLSKTDGWTYTDGSSKGTTEGATLNPWVGTENGGLPFGYTGKSALNWAAHITSAGDSLTISRADAIANHNGLLADIDTGAGAWQDTENPPKGWGHNTDIGLFKSDVKTNVSLKLTAVNSVFAEFGITLFTGADTGSDYSHHQNWNSPPFNLFTKDDPFLTTGVTYKAHQFNVNSNPNSSFNFVAEPGQIYSIYLGGYRGSDSWNTPRDFYSLSINTSPIPVPATAWLFGSGLLGLLSYGRRKKRPDHCYSSPLPVCRVH